MSYYVGDDEILGDDDLFSGEYDEIVGAEAFGSEAFGDDDDLFGGPKKRRPMSAAQKRALAVRKLARVRAAGGVEVAAIDPNQMRRQILPFSRSFTAAETATLSLQPQRKFRAERLSFASVTAQYFTVSTVSIAAEPQFVQDGQLMAQLFSEVSTGMELRGKTANLGAVISITATSIDAANTRILYGQITGTVVM